MSAGKPSRQQLGHHRLLDDLQLFDDHMGGVDGVVHGREDGSDLSLLTEAWQYQRDGEKV
ncbi:hypothetical protein BE20_18145 [Sorangium cellulosum]|uniref:Uncharacterized protein n=1 Tax=Sorangium cellulosum TaxID=56 RepID=A0A150RDP6_SORCE|nr:hypothetical protein BE18_16640 [Sorangium cellulosum]KYF90274.1 hypothetical protein BE20_18145 [Sorangium cellulosum]